MRFRVAAGLVFALLMFLIPLLALVGNVDMVQYSPREDASLPQASAPAGTGQAAPEKDPSAPAASSGTTPAVTVADDGFRILDDRTGKVFEVSARDYVRGALAAEMPPTFHPEALKAQAVAAHTYALRLREQNRTIGRQMDALGRRQREFAALAENMSEGVLLIDSRYHVLSGNQSAFHLLGEKQQPESIRQGTCRREIWEAAGKALAGRHAETLMRGESHIFEILASPVTANGQVTGAMILMVDVTEREERESLRREFSANVSHELKTPIAIIKGQLEGMIYQVGEYKDRDTYLRRCMKTTNDMEALVKEILSAARMGGSDFHLERTDLDISQMLQKVCQQFRGRMEDKEMELRMDIQPTFHYAGDGRLMEKVFTNVIGNAVAYSPVGATVTVSLQNGVFFVENSGVHIAEEDLKQIFTPFYRVDKSRNRNSGGSGLGLYITKTILDHHGIQHSMVNTEDGVRFMAKFS